MTIEAVPLDHCRRHNRLKTFRWIDASQDAWAAAAAGAAAADATDYSVASPLAANVDDLHAEARESCKVAEAGWMEARG